MTLALSTTPARPAAQSGGQSGAARPAASERADGFAAALRQTGQESRDRIAAAREASHHASPAEHAPSTKSGSREAPSARPSSHGSEEAQPTAATAGEPAGSGPDRGTPADASGVHDVVGVTSASAADATAVAGAPDPSAAAVFAWPSFTHALATEAPPAEAAAPVAAIPTAQPASAGAAALLALATPAPASAAEGARAAAGVGGTPPPNAPAQDAPPVTATRTEFLIRPTGSATAEAVTIVQADQALPPATAAPGAGVSAAATIAAPVSPVAPTASAAQAPPIALTAQVAKSLFTLSGVKPGEHVLTISVTPENLGPLTVRAHVTGDNIRVELFAPTDLAREAVRAILPDLRRDLAGGGLNAQLDLSSENQASDSGADAQAGSRQRPPPGTRDGPGDEPPPRSPRSFLSHSSSTIDVMA